MEKVIDQGRLHKHSYLHQQPAQLCQQHTSEFGPLTYHAYKPPADHATDHDVPKGIQLSSNHFLKDLSHNWDNRCGMIVPRIIS